MVETTLTRAAACTGSSAAALMPTGKPSEAPSPQSTIPRTTGRRVAAEHDQQTPTPAAAMVAHSTGTRP